ncbi:uncharacterized protein L969DRAFT_90539 [Mixia osmundae IAM 14324]|uniref:Muskelin N-terminal domain-containing protein n=1 Tax=Mixia osmundae (strain CBS 9802 / IAM 14324 / JCM 22182 / KY 12970) TaxID=764103 RepID=G7E2Q0_MIXOS|nr:uncharacterized protein L969DRAFT_90539 [Mixia osmundae IAM 14324]KEI36975.1 hypothetical protein L969DRAFT_90539 [Mixia osmundae IAM 14324]GAA97110.1 hypothetical protein E5Q_03785 [Mixia osmundae IAM 14324]
MAAAARGSPSPAQGSAKVSNVATYRSPVAIFPTQEAKPASLTASSNIDQSELNNSDWKVDKIRYRIHAYSTHSASYIPQNILIDSPLDQASRWSGASTGAQAAPAQQSGPSAFAASTTVETQTGDDERAWTRLPDRSGVGQDSDADGNPVTATVDTGLQPGLAPQAATRVAHDLPAALRPVDLTRSLSGEFAKSSRQLQDYLQGQERLVSSSATGMQYITLILDQVALVTSVIFGKYHKPHPCNLREFKIYGGLDADPAQMNLLFVGGLRNDSISEEFEIRTLSSEAVHYPCRYLRIEPIAAHSQNYNLSIWYVALKGVTDQRFVERICNVFSDCRETKALRLIQKHLRQRALLPAFSALQEQTRLSFEHDLVTKLHTVLVRNGDFDDAEELLSQMAIQFQLFDDHIQKTAPTPLWTRLDDDPATHSLDGDMPPARGGHQLVLCSETSQILLFGGWNGHQDLADLWSFSLVTKRWKQLSGNTARDGGPSARACHAATLDERTGMMYILGRYEDNASTDEPGSDLYCYYTIGPRAGTWELLSANTAADGGPKLIFDHQIAFDTGRACLYVFGGKIVQTKETQAYSGLYRYETVARKWTHILGDPHENEEYSAERMLARMGHSMLYLPKRDSLLIFGGQRFDAYYTDMWEHTLDTHQTIRVSSNYTLENGPPGGFTLRAIWTGSEAHLLSGLMREGKAGLSPRSNIWIKSPTGPWIRVESSRAIEPDELAVSEPVPRFAHQFVYDPREDAHYVFGGNPGEDKAPQTRLADFWRLKIARLDIGEVTRKLKFLIRKQRFIEMCGQSPAMSALVYLQTSLSSVTNHSDEREAAAFRACMASLLARPTEGVPTDVDLSMSGNLYPAYPLSVSAKAWEQRTRVFERITALVNPAATEPASNLIDTISVV